MGEKRVSVGRGKHRINLSAMITKDGLIVSIVGGEKPHAGAVAIGIPRYSLNVPSKISARRFQAFFNSEKNFSMPMYTFVHLS